MWRCDEKLCSIYMFLVTKSLILKVMEGDSTTSLLIFSNQLETNLKNMARSAVKMRLYGWCPALHLLHLLANWNSRHVVTALKGFTVKFTPKMRDMWICVGSECRLEKNKKQSKTKKRPRWTQTDVVMGKMLERCTCTQSGFSLWLSPVGGQDPRCLSQRHLFRFKPTQGSQQQTEILLTANTANQWQVYYVV